MVSSSGHICLLTDTADRAVLLSLLQGSRWFERPELLSGDLSQSVDVVVFAYAETISPDEVVRRLLASGHHPSVRPVVIIATNLSLPDAALFLRYGIRGMLDATELTPSVLHKCLDCVAAGELWAHQAQLLHLMSELSPLRPSNKARHAARLTIREHEVLSCLAEGLTNHEIGERLGVSDHTVKNHFSRVFEKLNVVNRTEAALHAMTHCVTLADANRVRSGVTPGGTALRRASRARATVVAAGDQRRRSESEWRGWLA